MRDMTDLAASIEALDLTALYSDLEQLEQRLTAIEEKLIARLRASASEEALFEARRALDRELKPYRGKMTAEQLAMLEKQFLDRRLLESAGLPRLESVLSLIRDHLRYETGRECVVLVCCVVLIGCARKEPSAWDKTDVMIPARDGVKLHTLIFAPKNPTTKLPFLIERSPYGFDNGRAELALRTRYKQLADEGFIFVLQDIRGRYQSEGQFVMQRPVRDRSNPKSIDEGTDTYDTIDWLLKNVPNNNGRAGTAGHFLWRLAHRHGADRAASGAEGRERTGLARRHVPGRRFSSQRSVSAELRV